MDLVEVKYKIQWFEGDVSPRSNESVCINDDEDVSDTEYESDSDIFWQWWRVIFQSSSETQDTLLRHTLVSHNILYESYKTSVTMYITLYSFMFN